LLVGISAGAQQRNVPAWPRVRVNVSILNENNAPAVAFKADALEVRDGGAVVHDAVLRPVGDAPESVCLVVDASGSMSKASNAIHAEVGEFIDKLAANDELCLVDFSSFVYMDAPLTTDRALVKKGVQYLKSTGASALLDAVGRTAKYMQENARYERRVIVLVSDGGENASKMTEDALRRELHRSEAPVVYSLVNWSGGIPDVHADLKRLLNLAEETGGLEFLVKTDNEAVQVADSLMQAVQRRYELEFTASNPAADGHTRKLRIALKEELRKQKIQVVGPDGYMAPQQ
jgi:VWFA-related protein